jgi:hypothetical protein
MKSKPWFLFLAIISGIAALAYLPLAGRFGYSYDDWYLMWAAKAYGPRAFFAIFSIDRPLRAYLMFPLYLLFGENALWYNLSAYAFRVLGGLAFGWMMQKIWPQTRASAISMALLFVIYPGFLSQPNAIDYQSHIVALTLALLSLALMVNALTETESSLRRNLLLILSVVSGLLYLGLMEYYIGFEVIRLLLIFLLALRSETGWIARVKKTIMNWLPLAVVPFGFVFWRVFIFVGERQATNAGVQLSLFLVSPIRAVSKWMFSLLKDSIDVLVLAWITPLSQLWGSLSGMQILAGLGLCLTAIVFVWYLLPKQSEATTATWRREALWLGLGSVAAGLIPVVLSNREVSFPYYSRYTLIASTGAVITLTTLVFSLPNRFWRQAALSVLILLSILTHFANSVKAANETASMNNFWWQVAWRIPQFEQNTTLVAKYPLVSIQEDYFVWGPANLIYYPKNMNEKDLQPGVFAAIPSDETVQKVLARERQQYHKRRYIITYANFRNILLLIQNNESECVRVIDGRLPEISHSDSELFKQMAPFSEIEHILTDFPQPTPPLIVFGPEPEHGWCYYYQKATLARQKGDWAEVRRLGNEASQKGLFHTDQAVEWLPFIQAYAIVGDTTKLDEISSHFRESYLLDEVECQGLANPQLSAESLAKLQAIFCRSQP